MVSIFANTDKVMLQLMLGEETTGFYSAALGSITMTGFVYSAIIDSARPSIFESQKISENSFEKNVIRLYSVIIYLSLLQSLLMTIFAPLIIKILYGSQYGPSVNVLRLAVWYTTFAYIGSVRNIWILAKNKQKYLWIINLSGATLNVVLNAIMIPIWGIVGASFASLLTQIFTNVIMNVIVYPIKRNNLFMLKS
jgi:PST family polysaccharide transporter